jgi:hypothetical protein
MITAKPEETKELSWNQLFLASIIKNNNNDGSED